jgi:acyl carrier protein
MGLDLVEVVMRTEEVFSISIPDEDAEQIRTVGDLYRIVLEKLSLPYLGSCGPTHRDKAAMNGAPFLVQAAGAPPSGGWTCEKVWLAVRQVVVDQLQVRTEEVTEDARFNEDLSAD